MEHYVRQAPDHYTAAQALRYGEARGFGGGEELVREIAIGPLGQRIEHADFWRTVLSFFVAHTEMKREHVNPIVDCHFPNGSSLPLPRAKEGEERENYFVGRLPRIARSEPASHLATAGLSTFAPLGGSQFPPSFYSGATGGFASIRAGFWFKVVLRSLSCFAAESVRVVRGSSHPDSLRFRDEHHAEAEVCIGERRERGKEKPRGRI